MALDFAGRGVDASEWALSGFLPAGKPWVVCAGPPPLWRRVDEVERDRFRVGYV
jgi:hypothetical protein